MKGSVDPRIAPTFSLLFAPYSKSVAPRFHENAGRTHCRGGIHCAATVTPYGSARTQCLCAIKSTRARS